MKLKNRTNSNSKTALKLYKTSDENLNTFSSFVYLKGRDSSGNDQRTCALICGCVSDMKNTLRYEQTNRNYTR